MLLELLSYIFTFIIAYIVSPTIVLALIYKSSKKAFDPIMHVFVAMALGPAVVGLLEYYLFMLVSGNPLTFYLLAIISLEIVLVFFLRSQIGELSRFLFSYIYNLYVNYKWLFILVLVILIVFFIAWHVTIFSIPLLRHDTFEYATWGKYIAKVRGIRYEADRRDGSTGFYYVALHGLIFPLFNTFNQLINNLVGASKDYFFRSITGWYWLLTSAVLFEWLRKYNLKVAILGSILFITAPAWVASFIYYHLDTFRLCFIVISSFYFFELLRDPNIALSRYLFGITAGIASNAHSLSVFFVAIQLCIYFLVTTDSLKNRVYRFVVMLLLMLLFGGFHYILETIFGTGWIFFNKYLSI